MVTRQITNAYLGGSAFNSLKNNLPTSPQGVFTVSIAGRWYGVDTNRDYQRNNFQHSSYPSQRQSINLTNIAGEGTVNTEGLWRREQNDWSMGSGQLFLDRQGSTSSRFYRSKGIDPWTKWQINALPATVKKNGYTGTLIKAIAVGNYVYVITTTGMYYTANYTTWTTAYTSTALKDVTDNGSYVFVVDGSTTVRQFPIASSTATTISHTGSSFYACSWQQDRLILADGPSLYSPLTVSAAPQLIWTHPNPDFLWTAFGSCQGGIYFGGYAPSDKNSNGSVYFSTYDTTNSLASHLTVPVQALPLTTGEYVTALYGYLNYMFVGTNKGIRMAQPSTGNYLTAGPLLPSITEPIKYPVTGITANGRFVYFAWNDYDDASTGIGRMDISTFIDTLAPAYASDLMVDWTGGDAAMTLDWDPITNGPLMSIGGTGSEHGLYTQDNTKYVTSGYVDSGHITFGIPDDKIASFIHLNTSQSVGNVTAAVSYNSGAFADVATMSAPAQSTVFPITPNQRGEYFNVRLTLAGVTQSSTVTRWTLQATPTISTETRITQVIQLSDVVDVNGTIYTYDPYVEYLYLDNIRRQTRTIAYTEGPLYADVLIDDLTWLPSERRDNFQGGYRGNLVVSMKTVNGFTYNPRPTD